MKISMLSIEVAYAGKNREFLISLELPADSTVKDALQASGILTEDFFKKELFAEKLDNSNPENPENLDNSKHSEPEHPNILDISALENRIGIFGKLVSLTTLLKPGDRVEIYRPLHLDPKEARRKRGTAETTKTKKEQRQAKALRRITKLSFRKRKDGD